MADEFGTIKKKEERFGIFKKKSAITAPEPQTQQQPFEPQIQIPRDEKGKPIPPKRPLTKDERELFTMIQLNEKWHDKLDLEMTWNLFVMYLGEVVHSLVAFSPETENITKRLRRVEKRLGIQVQEEERIGLDNALEEKG